MTRTNLDTQLKKIIDIDMQEVERGVTKPEMVKRRINQYIHHYGVDLFIVEYVGRYNAAMESKK